MWQVETFLFIHTYNTLCGYHFVDFHGNANGSFMIFTLFKDYINYFAIPISFDVYTMMTFDYPEKEKVLEKTKYVCVGQGLIM